MRSYFNVGKASRVELNCQIETPKLEEGQKVDEANFSYLGQDKDNSNNFTVAKQIETVLLHGVGIWVYVESIEKEYFLQSNLPRSFYFLVLLIVIGPTLKKCFAL